MSKTIAHTPPPQEIPRLSLKNGWIRNSSIVALTPLEPAKLTANSCKKELHTALAFLCLLTKHAAKGQAYPQC
uniref:Uncharacterized protein n=1 Tax=Cucumis melo TaxID=3656 RepID=A0A9I9EAI6_CUCME